VGYDADRLAAFNRLNDIRLAAGLGMVAQQPLMDRAAQAHADWEVANDVYSHEEQAGTPLFTGVEWGDRDESFGYEPREGEEVIASGYAAADAVDAFTNTAYHRVAILAMEPVDVGIGRSGLAAQHVSQPLVIDLAVPRGDAVRGQGQLAQDAIGGVAIWPLDGASQVRTHMGAESPNPVPGVDVGLLGTPASLTVASSRAVAVASFVVSNAATGARVPTSLLQQLGDPNALVPASYVAAIPTTPLSPGTTYSVAFTGTVTDLATGVSSALERHWRFTTGSL
jgi:hypothetical protein